MESNRAKMQAQFVAKVILHEGALWLSCRDDYALGRWRIQRMIRDGRISEAGVLDGEIGVLATLTRPDSDRVEVHIDTPRSLVREVRVNARTGAEETVETYFMDDFGQGLNPVRFTDEDEPSLGVDP